MKSDKDPEILAKARKESEFPPVLVILLIMGLYVGVLRLVARYEVSDDWGILSGFALVVAEILVAFALLMTVIHGWVGWKIVQVRKGVSGRRSVDITHRCTPPSTLVQPIIDALAELSSRDWVKRGPKLPLRRASRGYSLIPQPQLL